MKVVCDIEANGLENPDKVWVVVCLDTTTHTTHIFRNLTEDDNERSKFLAFASQVTYWIGHNWLEYDYPVLNRLVGLCVDDICDVSCDTLIVSRMADYARVGGHSLEAWGERLGVPKGDNTPTGFFKSYSKELEEYCVQDVSITSLVHRNLLGYISNPSNQEGIRLEHQFQLIVNDLHNRGFAFNKQKAEKLLSKVTGELNELDAKITEAFPSRLKLVREITPRLTAHQTLNRSDFRWHRNPDLSEFNGGPFCRCSWESFNPSSHKQLINVLHTAGWAPIDRTTTHLDTERELARLRYSRIESERVRSREVQAKLEGLRISGWKINETNLSTLPDSAPAPARFLARRILIESRRRTLTEWLGLVRDKTDRIHGRFYGIGAWTHRMSHQKPNVANIPNEFREDGSKKLLGKEMRQLWCAPRRRLLVGVDAEGIQLRLFAHIVEDEKLIDALVKGDKKLKTDPHNYNMGVLGHACPSRQAAKRFLYALFLGAGIERLAGILGCSRPDAQEALDRLLAAYPGFRELKSTIIPRDGQRGYFYGIDGRRVPIPGSTAGERKHLAMSGYLQNGEAIVVKKAACIAAPKLVEFNTWFVDIVHDEIQSESPDDMSIALAVAKIKADAIAEAGLHYKLKCPMQGSYWNDDHHDYTIGTNWYQTH